jgi:hypothetical protein
LFVIFPKTQIFNFKEKTSMKKLLVALTLMALASLAFAQSSSKATGGTAAPQFPSFGKHTLTGTYISNGDLGTSVPEGDSPLDAVHTISCPGTSGTCLFQIDAWVQVGRGTGAPVAICFYVDGSLVGNCYYSEDVPDNYIQVSTSTNAPGISLGSHTVQTHLYIGGTGGANVGYYNINYKVFKP